jgi:hypothetical protein
MANENQLSHMTALLKVVAANTEHIALNGASKHPHSEFCSICHPEWTHLNEEEAFEVCPICRVVNY